MQLDRKTGLYVGGGKSVRIELRGKEWCIFDAVQGENGTHIIRSKIPLFYISSSCCLSAKQALAEWLKTRPFR